MEKRPTILLAEDELLIAWALEEELRDAGVDVVGPCSTVVDCLVSIEQNDIDAAILDVDLGDEQVFAAAAKLEEQGVPFLFHTGRPDQTRLREFPSARVCPKPTPIPDLLFRLRELIDRGPARSQPSLG